MKASMKDTSLVQKIVTWTVVILLIILGISVLLNKDEGTLYDRPNPLIADTPTPGPEPMPIYPNNGKE